MGFNISIQRRFILFLLLPVAVLLFTVGGFGWYFARQALLDQWREAAVLRLQRAAHFIDMRLDRPIEWIEVFHKSGSLSGSRFSQQQVFEQLQSLEGVVRAELQWRDEAGGRMEMPGRAMGMRRPMGPMMQFSRGRLSRLTLPEYNAEQDAKTVVLASEQKEMDRINREMGAEALPTFQMGIGIHAGEVVVGNIGSEARAKYGIVGRAVNLTQRIQAAAEGGQVVVSEAVVKHAGNCLTVEDSFEPNLKGIETRCAFRWSCNAEKMINWLIG